MIKNFFGQKSSSSIFRNNFRLSSIFKSFKFVGVIRHLVEKLPGQDLGIGLAQNGVISSVESNSPADAAGLKKDQQIVEVSGENMRGKSNKEIAKIIKENEKNLVIGVTEAQKTSTTPITAVSVPAAEGLKFLMLQMRIGICLN